ncbi:MarR family winged helix-turn-helix transcriptional regulator [Paraburkholderia bannensis]|uniref:MarR family winged helix-turn-helix transcriptional regulator n=1 Tax=Paraburkholderia bannensis TaxID=765414 RepID=UPI002AB61B29|nr:MarR family transcriptional regulator [Paraburkholderia bannensis]
MRNTTKRIHKIAAPGDRGSAPEIPAPGEGKRGESGYIGYLLRQAGAAQRLRMERALDDLGVTPPQFVVLTMLVAYPGVSGADLARLAALTPQTVSVIVANLARNALIERTPHPVHGRIQQIEVTQAGQALLKQCRARVKKLEAQMLEGFSADEEQVIRRWLVALAREDGA